MIEGWVATMTVLSMGAVPTGAETTLSGGALAHALDRLATTTRVLYVAAHPDDENTRLLGFLANGLHYRAAYLSMTRGGGGQNLIGPEQDELLGVIRTHELLTARSLDGAEQRFTRMRDFGYSKSAAETFSVWDHDQALADVVRVIRDLQPDVVITRFDENPPNHGHHTASAILAREAVAAAADPAQFPEQLAQGLEPWKVDRLLHNVPTWREGPPPAGAIALDVGGYDPRLGLSYGELAARSRSQHKSQGFGVPGERGPLIERFVPVAGARPKTTLFEGLEPSWSRFGARAAPYQKAIDAARAALSRDQPERAIAALLEAHRALDALLDLRRGRDARRDLEAVIIAAAGLFLRATSKTPAAIPGQSVPIEIEVVLGRPAPIQVGLPGARPIGLEVGKKQLLTTSHPLPSAASPLSHGWLAQPPLPGRHQPADPALYTAPEGPAPIEVPLEVTAGDRRFVVRLPLLFGWTDRVHGERLRRVVIAPPATVTPLRDAVMVVNKKRTPLSLRVRSTIDDLAAELSLPLPAGWRAEPAVAKVNLARAEQEAVITFQITAPAAAEPAVLAPVLEHRGRRWSVREDRIDYPHLPLQVVLQPAELRVVPLALSVPRGLIGYVAGSGDSIAADLAHAGLEVEAIDAGGLESGDFGRYRAIILGIRAYNTNPALVAARERLLAWVERGGTLITQYNTHSRWDPLEIQLGPFPLEIGRDRITDQRAALTAIDPQHPLLRAPHPIGAADFEGWVQERGLYFAAQWDPRYQPILRGADPGEGPLDGGLLYARHGRGVFIYTGLAFFRQLPAGVPGAYRLLCNLIAARGK